MLYAMKPVSARASCMPRDLNTVCVGGGGGGGSQ